MTSLQFRSSPERVVTFRELLNNPVLAEAIVCLKDERPEAAVPPGSDALDRAAALARLEQHESDVNLLLSLAEHLPPKPTEESPTWGIDPKKYATT